jgi:hypothetical protein
LVHTIIDITNPLLIFVAIPSLLSVVGCDVSWCIQQYQAFTNLCTSPPPSPTLDSHWWIIPGDLPDLPESTDERILTSESDNYQDGSSIHFT